MTKVLLFAADNGTLGYEPYVTNADGTEVTILGDFYPGSDGSIESGATGTDRLGDFGAYGLMSLNDDKEGYELWKTDGTPDGTERVKDINEGGQDDSSYPGYNIGFTQVGNLVFFDAYTEDFGIELWVTDGTEDGTRLTRDLSNSDSLQYGEVGVAFGDLFLFSATDGATGYEPYTSDGTETGTRQLKDIYSGSEDSYPSFEDGGVLGDRVFFSAYSERENGSTTFNDPGRELWITDGTEDGTEQVRDINPNGDSYPTNFQSLGETMYFSASDGTTGNELWRSDGTSGGTQRVKDIYEGSESSDPAYLTQLGDMLVFTARDSSDGNELWITDGSSGGTKQLVDIWPGGSSSDAQNFTPVGDGSKLVFTAHDGSNGYELWITDGTAVGTELLKDIYEGSGSSDPYNFVEVDGLVYFSANAYEEDDDKEYGVELWVTDGTEEGTRLVDDIRRGDNGSDPVPLAVIDINGAPTELALDGASVPETASGDTVVGTLSALDPDGDELTFELTDDADGLFEIDGNNLLLVGALDFEDEESHEVTVEAIDANGLKVSKTFTIEVEDVNDAPEDLELDGDRVSEGASRGTSIGRLSATDADGDDLDFALTDDAGGLFRLSGRNLVLNEQVDFEDEDSHEITVEVSDGQGGSIEKSFTIDVEDENERPEDLKLSNQSVDENSKKGTVVGSLSANDPDGDSLFFSLTSSAGGRFALDGNDVVVNGLLDFEASKTRTITVEAEDRDGLFTTERFTIDIGNVADPTEGPDKLTGTSGNDKINSLGGSDKVVGKGGDDTLKGGDGNDTLKGGDGGDELRGENHNDVLQGNNGPDKLYGGKGQDNLKGGKGTDSLDGGKGGDTLDGGKGNDKITTGNGNDTIVFRVEEGKDTVFDFKDDSDTLKIKDNLWDGDLSRKQVVNAFAKEDGDNLVLRFSKNDKVILVDYLEDNEVNDLVNDLLIF